jgi:hypothetical protein
LFYCCTESQVGECTAVAGTLARPLRDAVDLVFKFNNLVMAKIPQGVFDPISKLFLMELMPNRIDEEAMFP